MMWFAKWFGGRDDAVEEDEPARYAAPETSKPIHSPTRSRACITDSTAAHNAPAKGFDPYNSGAFERRNAWERTGRR